MAEVDDVYVSGKFNKMPNFYLVDFCLIDRLLNFVFVQSYFVIGSSGKREKEKPERCKGV